MLMGGLTHNVLGCLIKLSLLGQVATDLHNKATPHGLWPDAPGFWQTQANYAYSFLLPGLLDMED